MTARFIDQPTIDTISLPKLAKLIRRQMYITVGNDRVGPLFDLAAAIGIVVDAERVAVKRRQVWASHKARNARCRAEDFGCSEHFSARQWLRLVDYYGGCVACGVEDVLSVDHIVPLAKGGNNTLRNIQPLCCDPCHKAKERVARLDGIFIDYRETLPDWIQGVKNA